MGLDITCKCGIIDFRAGSYSSFHNFREALAKAVGINLMDMAGFSGTKSWTGDEPFYELLNHSDCDGVLLVSQCEELLKDFDTFTCAWSKEDVGDSYYLEKFELWEKAIKHAVENKCRLEFW